MTRTIVAKQLVRIAKQLTAGTYDDDISIQALIDLAWQGDDEAMEEAINRVKDAKKVLSSSEFDTMRKVSGPELLATLRKTIAWAERELDKMAKEERLASTRSAGEVPEAFKKNWKKKPEGEKAEKPDFLKEKDKEKKSSDARIAHELMCLAKCIATGDCDCKPCCGERRDRQAWADFKQADPAWLRSVDAALRIACKVQSDDEPIYKAYLTVTEGSHNKFHYFAVWQTDDGNCAGGNAYGRIGERPTAIMIEQGDKSRVLSAVQRKQRSKEAKGYHRVEM